MIHILLPFLLNFAAVVQVKFAVNNLPPVNWVYIGGGTHRHGVRSVPTILGCIFIGGRFEKFQVFLTGKMPLGTLPPVFEF